MAGGIKGITVKIGGDTTELGRSLSDATTKSTALQRELKGVNSLLKVNPNNFTLLKQKADLLKQSIAETEAKQKALNEVLKKVDSGEIEMTEEEYRNLQREIASTDGKLSALKEQSKQFGSAGATYIANVGEKVKDVGTKVEDLGKKFMGISAVTGAVLGGSVLSASNFEDAMAKVNTIADTSKVSLKDLSGQVLGLSNQTGISAEDIADATYNAISAGQDTADAVNFVSNATSLAKAGFTDTGSSIDILTTIMNAYGLSADKVGSVSDMLIQTQNKGKTTVAELSSSMGKIIPTANSMGVGLNQLCAGYSIMTARGIATAESTTYMNSMLNELGKGGTKVSEALKNKTGKSFQELMADGNSLGDVLQIVKDYADETGTGFNDLWSSSEAGKAGLVLLSDGADGFNEAVAGMNDSTGATADALGKLDTPSQKAKVAMTQLKNAGITLGQTALSALAPLIDKISTAVQKLTTWFSGLSPQVQQIILVVLAVITAIGPLLIVIGKLTQGVGTVMTWAPKIASMFGTIGQSVAGAVAPFLAVIAIIAVLVGAFVHLWKTNEDFRNKITEIWNGIVEKFKTFFQGITDRLNALGFDFSNFGEVVKAIWEGLCNFLAPIFEGAFQVVSAVLGTVLDVLTGLLDVFIGIFTGNWSQVWTGVKEIFSGVWNGIKGIFSGILTALTGAVNVFLGWFGTNWSTVWNGIKSFFEGIWNGIKSFFTTAVNAISTVATTVFTAISTFFSTVWNGIKNTISTVITAIKTTIETVFNAIRTTITNIINGVSTVISTVFNTIRNTISTIVNGISSTISSVWNGIKSVTSSVWNGIKTAISTPINAIKSTVSSVVNGISSTVGSVWNGIKSVTTSVWNGIKNAITSPVETAKNVVSGIVDKIKGVFNFKWSLPHLNLPHISVSGGEAPFGIMGKGSLPHFSIDWYKDGAIFKKPTLFPTNSGFKGVGEAGAEAVAPISDLLGYVQTAVNTSNYGLEDRLARIEGMIESYLPTIAGRNTQIVLDTGTLVGETIDKIDSGLANNQILRARGV